MGHGTRSFTNETSWVVGHYLGDKSNPCITIIDTPGTSDTSGRDCEHGIALAEAIKQIGSIDAFVLLFKGINPRFDESMKDQIKLFLEIFGQEMWQNTITEFTFWGHDKKSITTRKKHQGGLSEDTKHSMWNMEYSREFGVQHNIPSIFIDPIFDEETAETDEKKINKKNTDYFWNFLTQRLTTFHCDKRCQAPSGFFAGQPWLLPENGVQYKRLGDRTVVTWQIWLAGCDGSGTKSYDIWHQDVDNITSVIYEHFDNNTIRNDRSKLMKGMQVLDEPTVKLKTIRIIIEPTEEHHFGSYFIENRLGRSDLGQLKKIIDGEWQEWSPFSTCSKTCISCYDEPGLMQRQRTCLPPHNGGKPCEGESKEEKACAHHPQDDGSSFRYDDS